MTRLGYSETKITAIATAVAISIISIFGAHQALASNPSNTLCTERPWTCAPEASAIVTAMRHGVAKQRSVAYSTLSAAINKTLPAFDKSSKTPRHLGKFPKLHDLVPQLAAKVGEIISTCGSKLISGFRPHAVVAGTHRASLHSRYPSEAADISGAPSCAYALLRNWPGGVSVDYGRVHHIHLSYEPHGREWGARFSHYAHSRHHRRKAA